jgi:hypothetical protein
MKKKNKKTKVVSKKLSLLPNNSSHSSSNSINDFQDNLPNMISIAKRYSKEARKLYDIVQSEAPNYPEYLYDASKKYLSNSYSGECTSENHRLFSMLTCSLDEIEINLDLLQVKFPENQKIDQAMATLNLIKKEIDKVDLHTLSYQTLMDVGDYIDKKTLLSNAISALFDYFHWFRVSEDISFPPLDYPFCCTNKASDYENECEDRIFSSIHFFIKFFFLSLSNLKIEIHNSLNYHRTEFLYNEFKNNIQKIRQRLNRKLVLIHNL